MKFVIILVVFCSLVSGKPSSIIRTGRLYKSALGLGNINRPIDKIEQMYDKLIPSDNELYFAELGNITRECKDLRYRNSFCLEKITPVVIDSIKNMRNHILTTVDTKVLLDRLSALHEAVFFSNDNSYDHKQYTLTPDVVRNIYDMVRGIRWTGNIMDTEQHLITLISKVSNIFLFSRALKEEDYKLEVVDYFFSHLFTWKARNLRLYNYIIRAHFYVLKRIINVYPGKDLTNFLHKILYNLERTQTIVQKLYPEDFVKSYKLFLYIDLLNERHFTPDVLRSSGVSLDYDIISQDDVLKKKDTFQTRGGLRCTIHHNQNGEEIIAFLRKVEEDFVKKMNMDVNVIGNIQKDVALHIFDSNDDYRKYDQLFDYESDNGGVTYNSKDESRVYMYNTAYGVRNLGHEFIHVIAHFYITNSTRVDDVPLFVIEGLAEAVGQELCDTRIMSYAVPANFSTVDYIFQAISYKTTVSPYTVGNIVMSYALEYGHADVIKESYNGHTDSLKNVIRVEKERLQNFAQWFINESKKCHVNTPDTASLRFLQKYSMDEKDIIVCIDNTYFYLYEDRIQMVIGDRENFILNSSVITQNVSITSPIRRSDLWYFIDSTIGGIFLDLGVPHMVVIGKPVTLYKNNKLVTKNSPLHFRMFKKLYEMLIEFVDESMEKNYERFVFKSNQKRIKLKELERDLVDLVTVNYNVKAPIHRLLYKINSAPLITRQDLDEISRLDMKLVVSGTRTIGDIVEDSFSIADIYNKNIAYIKRATGIDYLSKNTIYPLRYELGFRHASSKFRLVPGQSFEGVPDLITMGNNNNDVYFARTTTPKPVTTSVTTPKPVTTSATTKPVTTSVTTKKPGTKLINLDWSFLDNLKETSKVTVQETVIVTLEPKAVVNQVKDDGVAQNIEKISINIQDMKRRIEDIYRYMVDKNRQRRHIARYTS
jgi:hypothetical protein